MSYRLSDHAVEMIERKGFDRDAVERVVAAPDIEYPSNKFPWQKKLIGEGLCVVVDPRTMKVVTVFEHMVRTALREDQK